MGRESFLKKTAEAVMVAGAMVTTGASFETPESPSDRTALYLQLNRDINALGERPFDFRILSEKSRPAIVKFIAAFDGFDSDYDAAYGIQSSSDAGTKIHAPSQHALLDLRQKLWGDVHTLFPDTPPYTEEGFYRTMVCLPERLARLGIRTEVGVYAAFTRDGSVYDIIIKCGRFFPIKRIEHALQTHFGKTIDLPMLHLDNPLGINTAETTGQEMAALFGAVGVFPSAGKRYEHEWVGAREKIPHALSAYGEKFGGLPLSEPTRRDYVVFTALNDLVQHENPPTKADFFDSIRAHEGAHVFDEKDAAFSKQFVPSDHELLDQNREHILHKLSHDEVDGFLSGLWHGRGNYALYAVLVNALSDHEKKGPAHYYAARWIIDHSIPMIIKNPERFGFVLQAPSSYTAEEQALGALPDICRTHPAVMESIWEELWNLHRAQLSDRIYRKPMHESGAADEEGVPAPVEKKHNGLTVMLVAGVGVFATILATRAALKLREKNRKEREVHTENIERIREVLSGCKDGERLFQDLQLDVTGRQLNAELRERAYGKIIEIARESSLVRKNLQLLKEFIGKE